MKNKKGSRRNRNKSAASTGSLPVDRFTKLPEDVLLNILDRLNTPDAVRTCLLSKRTLNLRHLLSNFVISAGSFFPDSRFVTLPHLIQANSAVADATDNVLSFRSQDVPLHRLSICFYLKYYDCLTIGKAVSQAMATYNQIDSVEFIILTELQPECYTVDDFRRNGKQFMTFLGSYPDAFAGLTQLFIQNLRLAEADIPNILSTCKRLQYLRMSVCDSEDSVLQLQLEHPRLVELDIYDAGFHLVDLKSLPNLKRLVFGMWVSPGEPLSFGNVPMLSSLSLNNVSAGYQEVFRLSHFLANVPNISNLHLSFASEKIWVKPECPKLLAPVLQKLRVLNLDRLPEGCDIAWTRFFLEAAPNLKKMSITVWDHWCDMETDSVEREELGYRDKTNVEWQSSQPDGFKHHNLVKLIIYGFQPDDNFIGYIRCMMEAAVNLVRISLYDRRFSDCCSDLDPKIKIKVAPSRFPRTIKQQELKKSAAHNNPQLVVDRFTKLPDDLLLNILDRLNTPDAVRTCLLSKRTIHLRHLLSRFQISVDSFVPDCGYATLKDTIPMNAAVADATDSILNFRRQDIPLRHLSVCFYLKYYDCLTIGKAVARAMATNNLLDNVEFIILPEKKPEHYSTYDLRHNGKQLMRFFGACTDAFAGLTRLYLRNLKLGETDIPNIIATCKLLEYLRLSFCETEDSVLQLQVEHPRLVELDIYHASLELVELNYLPNLKHLDFSLWVCPHEPLSFGNVPLLSSLSLTNVAMRYQEVIRLSHFLANVPNISDLYLNFGSEKIWVQPECPKLLAPVLRNLQVLNLDELPEECDISWTCFFLEAAPSLKEMRVTVWDHWCGMQTNKVEREEQGYSEKKTHYNLTKLTIYGFQPNDNFLGYIRHIMEAAVNLEDVSLYDRKVLECCEDLDPKIKVAPSGYPETIQEQELLKRQITEGLVMVSPHVIHFRS
uniref:F-box domain-containing protein n=1 Tax=Oryza glumipatula TaxID=40148 RepID=A0A0D9Z0E9_9ORYZ